MEYIIYGAQGYALGAYKAFKLLYPEKTISFFVVSQMGSNANKLEGIPVIEIDNFVEKIGTSSRNEYEFIIAVPDNIQDEIVETLKKYGFKQSQKLDYNLWSELMDKYHGKLKDFLPLNTFERVEKVSEIEIYVARSHKDKALNNSYEIPEYAKYIQVGAANCLDEIADIKDNIGDNISNKNGNYCELTGLYWIWKNAVAEDDRYYGLAQYRRMFEFSYDDLLRIGKVDVILPYPLPYDPDNNEHHKRYLKDDDWNAVVQALKEIHPEYCDKYAEVFSQQYLYNYNVIVAKGKVLREYCEWLFPVLERIENLSFPKGEDRADRYIGYIGENLETLFFMSNQDKYKIAHCGCRVLS